MNWYLDLCIHCFHKMQTWLLNYTNQDLKKNILCAQAPYLTDQSYSYLQIDSALHLG